MTDLESMQVRLTSHQKHGEAIFLIIRETPYDEWEVLIIHSTDWFASNFPPGSSGAWNCDWLRINTVVIA